MSNTDQTRIPVVFGGAPEPGDILLLADGVPAPHGWPWTSVEPAPHWPGCACCPPRNQAARALSRLFLARARGQVSFFRRVRVQMNEDGLEIVRQALEHDVMAAARFRLVSR